MEEPAEPRRRGRPPRLTIEERRAVVLDAALDLFAADGRAATTMDSVATRAGIQKPSVYRLFPSKDELYRATVEREVDRFTAWVEELYAATTGEALEDRTRSRARAVVGYAVDHRVGMALLTRALRSWPDEALPVGEELRRRVLGVLARFAEDEGARDGVVLGDAAEAMATITFALTEAVVELAVVDGRWSQEALADLLAETAVGAIVRADPTVWLAVGASPERPPARARSVAARRPSRRR